MVFQDSCLSLLKDDSDKLFAMGVSAAIRVAPQNAPVLVVLKRKPTLRRLFLWARLSLGSFLFGL